MPKNLEKDELPKSISFHESPDILLSDASPIKRSVPLDTPEDLTMSPVTRSPLDIDIESTESQQKPKVLENFFRPKDYQLTKRLGRGEFGEVYLATSSTSGERIVMKRIPKNSPTFKWNYIQREEEAGYILKNEGIVPCFTKFETTNNVYLVFPYFEAKDLITYLEDRNFWPLEDKHAKSIIRQIVVSLMFCHSKGIGHRDVKLENILIDKNGKIKLIDFGLCTLNDDRNQKHEDKVGSLDYAAPELLLKKPYSSFKADVFSTGVVLYCLLLGKFPFVAEERAQNIRKGIDTKLTFGEGKFSRLFSSISKEAKDLLTCMLEPNPEKRIAMEEIMGHKWFSKK